ncbi:MAG: response regulator transcription factor [Acidobacteria bacterium]|nr:response regulator transcription factor [Acidobacteriota bacterium]
MIRVFIVAGVRLYCDALAEVLARAERLCVVGAHAGGNGALAHLASSRPDVALLDMAMPQSHELARDVQRSVPEISVVALGVGASDTELLTYAEAGIAGYVHAGASLDELIEVIESAARGELICSPRLARELVRSLAALAGTRAPDSPQARLTLRECQILALLEQHLSNKEIAIHLGIEVATVRNHVHNILKKLGVRRRHDAIRALKPAQRAVAARPDPRGDPAVPPSVQA